MLDVQFGNLTWLEVKQAVEEDYIVLLPVGTTEQHGPHLPVCTDDRFAQKWALDAALLARKRGVKVLVCPPIHYGDSLVMSSFPGTLAIRAETLMNLVYDVADALFQQGFRRVVIVNVHGGNRPAVNLAAQRIKARYYGLGKDILIRVADDTDSDMLTPSFWEAAQRLDPEAAARRMYHAGSLETAKMLVIDENLVDEDRFPDRVNVERPRHVFFLGEVNPTGAMGDPHGANKAAGEMLWDELIANLAAYLERIS
jgi:creatinine amidohydrolase